MKSQMIPTRDEKEKMMPIKKVSFTWSSMYIGLVKDMIASANEIKKIITQKSATEKK